MNTNDARASLRPHQRLTASDTPGLWMIGHLGNEASVNVRPGWALLFPVDADAELYLLAMEQERGWAKIVRPVDGLTLAEATCVKTDDEDGFGQ